MNDILFRGKRVDNGELVYGLVTRIEMFKYPQYLNEFWIATGFEDEAYPVITETISQYIGRKDINGKKIFENDVVYIDDLGNKWVVEYDENEARFIVCDGINSQRSFELDHSDYDGVPIVYITKDKSFKPEVVGTIHDKKIESISPTLYDHIIKYLLNLEDMEIKLGNIKESFYEDLNYYEGEIKIIKVLEQAGKSWSEIKELIGE